MDSLNEKIRVEINELNENEIKNDGFHLPSKSKITLLVSDNDSLFLLICNNKDVDSASNAIGELSDIRGLIQLSDDEIRFLSHHFSVADVYVRYSDHDDGGVFKWACKDFIPENISSLNLSVDKLFNKKNIRIEKCFFDFTSIEMKRNRTTQLNC